MTSDDAMLWAMANAPGSKTSEIEQAALGYRAGHAAAQSAAQTQVAELVAALRSIAAIPRSDAAYGVMSAIARAAIKGASHD